jgi:CxxC-x17-CxxC domain-containing protein
MNKFNKKPRDSRSSGRPGDRPRFGGSAGARPRTGAGPRGSRPFGNRDRSRDDKEAPQKFDAVCSNCGKKCQVPFRPSASRPVYCNDCFGAPHDAPKDKKDFSSAEGRTTAELTRQIAAMNNKIDLMLKILQGEDAE